MRIKSIRLERFRKFEELAQFNFQPGINLIIGPNEAGKSTIQQAIQLLLYASPSSTSRELQALRSWNSEDSFRLEMEIEDQGKQYQLVKDFEKGECELKTDGRDRRTKEKSVQEKLAELVGTPDLQVFKQTACVNQDELGKALQNPAEMVELLRDRIIGIGEISLKSVEKKLTAEIDNLEKGMRGRAAERDPGDIFQTETMLQQLLEQKKDLDAQIQEWNEQNQELDQLITELAQIEPVVNKLDQEVKKDDQYQRLAQELDRLTEQAKRSLEAREFLQVKKQKQELLNSEFAGFDKEQKEIELKRQALEQKVNRKKELEKDFFEKQKQASPQKAEKPAMAISWAVGLGIIGLVIFVLGIVLFLSPVLKIILLALALGISVASLLWLFNILAQKPKKEAVPESELTQLSSEIEEISGGISRLESELAPPQKRIEKHQKLTQEIENLEQRAKDVSGLQEPEKLESQYQEITVDRDGKKHSLEPLAIYKLDPIVRDSKENELREFRTRLEDIRDRKRLLEKDICRVYPDRRKYNLLCEQIAELTEKASQLKRELKVLKLVEQGIEAAANNLHERVFPMLEEKVSRTLPAFTQNRYSKIKISLDGRELSIKVFSDQKPSPIEIDELSQATREQVYLSARLGLAEMISATGAAPLILDDAFAHFDPQRFRAAMQVLSEISKSRQVIIFSPEPRGYQALSPSILTLT